MTRWEILHGDCLEKLKGLPDCSVDAVVTDPPYDLTSGSGAGGFMGKAWDATGIAFRPDVWLECLRVLKPGGHLLAFGGTRTYHRMACAIEDAGFEIRDSIHWMYGSGFPKSLDVSKAIDKQAGAERARENPQRRAQPSSAIAASGFGADGWAPQVKTPITDEAKAWLGWGTALKPAHEPIVVARKPLDGTVAANVLAHGTGAINVDGCRVGEAGGTKAGARVTKPDGRLVRWDEGHRGSRNEIESINAGRWPPNVVFSHLPACGESCAEGCAVAELDAQSGFSKTPAKVTRGGLRSGASGLSALGEQQNVPCFGDSGGASRFFPAFRYQAKPSRRERDLGLAWGDVRSKRSGTMSWNQERQGNAHPTVKPIELMRWCIRLVTPKGGLVLDPFTGSGTTGIAALLEGFRFIGCEREDEYLAIANARLAAAEKQLSGKQGELFSLEEAP